MTPGMPKPAARSAMLSAATDQVRAGRLGVAVVLRDEDRRQVPHRRQVHRLQRGALVRGAVAEERDADAAVALELGRQRGAADQRRPAADDAVRAEHALGQVGDVHRAALAATRSRPPPKISAIIGLMSTPLAMQ